MDNFPAYESNFEAMEVDCLVRCCSFFPINQRDSKTFRKKDRRSETEAAKHSVDERRKKAAGGACWEIRRWRGRWKNWILHKLFLPFSRKLNGGQCGHFMFRRNDGLTIPAGISWAVRNPQSTDKQDFGPLNQ